MQGYYQIAKFNVPAPDVDALVDYIVVSRRSRDRAGLRYQRRGIDDEAHVANFVETETIMRVEVFALILVPSFMYLYLDSAKASPTFLAMCKYGVPVRLQRSFPFKVFSN